MSRAKAPHEFVWHAASTPRCYFCGRKKGDGLHNDMSIRAHAAGLWRGPDNDVEVIAVRDEQSKEIAALYTEENDFDRAGKYTLVKRAPAPSVPALTQAVVDDAKEFIAASSAESTRRAYSSDWKLFNVWCAANKLASLPAEPATVVLYLTTLAREGKKVATIKRAKTSIAVAHATANQKDPCHSTEVKRAMQGIARTIGSAPNKKAAVLADDLKTMLSLATRDIEDETTAAYAANTRAGQGAGDVHFARARRATRDRALLAIWFAGGFRRSEVAAIEREHLIFDKRLQSSGQYERTLAIFLPKSKTDQEGKGRTIGIVHEKTIEYVHAWVEVEAEITRGPVFIAVSVHGQLGDKALDGEAVAEVVKKYALKAGLDPKNYAGHSLRRGHVTTAKRNGVANEDIMRQTGHKSVQTFMGYIEEAGVFDNNSSKGLWK